MAPVQQVVHAVGSAIAQQDGEALAEALQQIDLSNAALIAQLTAGRIDVRALSSSVLDRPYDEMLAEQLDSLVAIHCNDHVKAYSHQERACTKFHSVFEKDTSWSLPAMHRLDLLLRMAAVRADATLKKSAAGGGDITTKQEEAVRVLQKKSFTICISDRAPLEVSKKWGTLHVINNLFKIYFKLNKLTLCKNLIKAVEGSGFPKALNGEKLISVTCPPGFAPGAAFVVQDPGTGQQMQVVVPDGIAPGQTFHVQVPDSWSIGRSFPMAQLVTYHYFVGRLSLLNSQFGIAQDHLLFSFERCPAASYKNKRLILRYLVPVRLVLGVFASKELLTKYDLPQFVPLCHAVHRGDLRLFERQLDDYQHLFIRHGSYLLVERAKTIAYRNFFRRVYSLHPEGTTKLDVAMLKRCLDATGVNLDHDEIECVLANLIYKGYIKGYLSHQHGKLVVGKTNAFPALGQVNAS